MATKAQVLPRHRNPERVAWTVLVSSFAAFVVLLTTVLFGGAWWLRNATVNQTVAPVFSGTVLVTRPGALAPQANPPDIPIESAIVTDANVQATLSFTAGGGQTEIATVQIYGGSEVHLIQASSPRFGTGLHPHHIILGVSGGRVRAFVVEGVERPIIIDIRSGAGAVTRLEAPGTNAEVEVTPAESMVTVREGQATVSAAGLAVVLDKDQRTQVLPGAGPGEAVPAERNLVRNGDFRDALDTEWALDIWAPADPAESPGEIAPVTVGGRPTVRFQRTGINSGRVGLVQTLDRDVRGYTTLRLRMEVLLASQDLINCGQLGSECPLMVKLDYTDIYGVQVEWLHGFFFNYDPTKPGLLCVTCPGQWPHEPWPKGRWQTYDSPNLLELFAANGNPAATLRSITLYASGHTFSSFVTDVQLLAE